MPETPGACHPAADSSGSANAKGGSEVPMVSTGGDQSGVVDGAFRQQEHPVSPQGCSSLSMGFSAWQELEPHEAWTWTISVGSQQDTPEAVLITQQHTIITTAVSRVMMRWAICRLRDTMNAQFYPRFRRCRLERSYRGRAAMSPEWLKPPYFRSGGTRRLLYRKRLSGTIFRN